MATDTDRDLARNLAARALNAAMRGEWSIAAAIVRRLNADCGSAGTMTAVVGWCDTLIQRTGLTGHDPAVIQYATNSAVMEPAETPVRVQWAAQLIMARARLDEVTFNELIRALPSNPKTVGSYVGTVLECVALTLNEGEGSTDG